MTGYVHDWKLTGKTTPSGKILYKCSRCGITDPAPVKPKYEHRPCKNNQPNERQVKYGPDPTDIHPENPLDYRMGPDGEFILDPGWWKKISNRNQSLKIPEPKQEKERPRHVGIKHIRGWWND